MRIEKRRGGGVFSQTCLVMRVWIKGRESEESKSDLVKRGRETVRNIKSSVYLGYVYQ